MHILVVSQYFWPENFRINDLVTGLIDRGHRVTVLTGIPNYPEGRFFDGYGLLCNTSHRYHGATVLRVPIFPRGKGGGARLALNYLSFVLSASVWGPLRCSDRYDVIFVFGPSPVTVALPALLLKSLRKVPVMFWVQDLWPESLSATGAVTSRLVLNVFAGVVRFIYRRCDRILIASQSFKESVELHAGRPESIVYFPQSAEDVFRPHVAKQPLEALALVPPGFRIMFAGNIGVAQDFRTIIDCAERLNGYNDIHFVIVGDGRMREWAEREARDRGLNARVHFVGKHPLEEMPVYFSHADGLLVTLKKEPIFALTIPAKVQSYLACGRPIIAGLDGEGAKIVAEAGAGFTCQAEDPDALADAVLKLYHLPKDQRDQMGLNGRKYYEAHFDRGILLDKLTMWMHNLGVSEQES